MSECMHSISDFYNMKADPTPFHGENSIDFIDACVCLKKFINIFKSKEKYHLLKLCFKWEHSVCDTFVNYGMYSIETMQMCVNMSILQHSSLNTIECCAIQVLFYFIFCSCHHFEYTRNSTKEREK